MNSIIKNTAIIQVNVEKNKKSKLSAEAITFNHKKRIYGESKYYQLPNQTLPFSCFCTVYLVY